MSIMNQQSTNKSPLKTVNKKRCGSVVFVIEEGLDINNNEFNGKLF